jgi:hypothetical protein
MANHLKYNKTTDIILSQQCYYNAELANCEWVNNKVMLVVGPYEN